MSNQDKKQERWILAVLTPGKRVYGRRALYHDRPEQQSRLPPPSMGSVDFDVIDGLASYMSSGLGDAKTRAVHAFMRSWSYSGIKNHPLALERLWVMGMVTADDQVLMEYRIDPRYHPNPTTIPALSPLIQPLSFTANDLAARFVQEDNYRPEVAQTRAEDAFYSIFDLLEQAEGEV